LPLEAIRYLTRLTRLTPYHANVFLMLGKLYLQQRQYNAAALHLWEARHLQSPAPEIDQLLLYVYEQLLRQQREVLQRHSPPPTPSVPSVARDGQQRGK
jgi:hypothetical protein